MFPRRLLLTGLTLAGVGIPYAMYQAGMQQPAAEHAPSGAVSPPPAAVVSPASNAPAPQAIWPNASPRQAPLAGPAVREFGDVLRFDVDPHWVLARWAHVGTATEQPHLKGYRVPLCTGTQVHDLAGSLTYYFNAQQQVQRLVFHGTTGDFRPLVAWATRHYRLRSVTTPQAGMHLYRGTWNGRATSELCITPAPVVQAQLPHRRYEVHLLLERPEQYKLFAPSSETTALIPR
jgi:hypothetical protein